MTQIKNIYYYTSVENLALILSSRKIRFSRLDGVDDALEGPVIDGIHFNKYFFVSCWTSLSDESIPQWHLYTDTMTGVRIELPSYPFVNKLMTPPSSWANYEHKGTLFGPLGFEEMFKPTYMLLPMFMDSNNLLAQPSMLIMLRKGIVKLYHLIEPIGAFLLTGLMN